MDKIDEILTRGVETIVSNREELEGLLRSGRQLNVYFGIDPTAPKIHIGHAFPLRKLQLFVDLGHNVSLLFGNFTARVGDTSDKTSERPRLTPEQIDENVKTFKDQAAKILDLSKVKVVYNSEWLSKLTFTQILELYQHFSLNDFISRELIKKRLQVGDHIKLDELTYPVMQGYDSYFLDTDIQICGTDQIFNAQAGRTLQKDLRNKESFIISNGFLPGTDGNKMSKTSGNGIWLEDSPENMFGKTMSVRDDLILDYFKYATNLPLSEISQIAEELAMGKNPMLIKKTLAHEIVRELHSEEDAELAQEQWELTFQNKDLSAAIKEQISLTDLATSGEATMLDVLSQPELTHITGSKAEAKRLFDNNAIELNGQTISREEKVTIKPGDTLKIGKKRFFEFTK